MGITTTLRQVLHRWTQILSIAYSLPQLLATYCEDQAQPLLGLTSWRKKNHVTAGLVRLGLQLIFDNVLVRTCVAPEIEKVPTASAGETNTGTRKSEETT